MHTELSRVWVLQYSASKKSILVTSRTIQFLNYMIFFQIFDFYRNSSVIFIFQLFDILFNLVILSFFKVTLVLLEYYSSNGYSSYTFVVTLLLLGYLSNTFLLLGYNSGCTGKTLVTSWSLIGAKCCQASVRDSAPEHRGTDSTLNALLRACWRLERQEDNPWPMLRSVYVCTHTHTKVPVGQP